MQCLSYIYLHESATPCSETESLQFIKQYELYSSVCPYNCIVAREQLSVSVQNYKHKSASMY